MKFFNQLIHYNPKKKAKTFFTKNTAHIEVLRIDKTLEKYYFYILPFCHSLDDDKTTRTEFNESVNRISVKSKQTALMQKSKELIQKIKHEYRLRSYLSKIAIVSILA